MGPQIARLDRSGRLVLPAEVRSALELREGDEVVFVTEPGTPEARLIPRRAALRRAQQLMRQYLPPGGSSMVDELIAERRADAARDEAEWAERNARR